MVRPGTPCEDPASGGEGPPPRVFDYSDYRLYLKDYFAHKRRSAPRTSLRAFAAGINPRLSRSGLLSGVLKGTRNLGHSLRADFCRALGLKEREARYFELLVQFNQAEDVQDRSRIFAQLSRFRHSRVQTIFEGQYRFFTKWYYPVIWNFFGIRQNISNLAEIGGSIHPRLTVQQVQESISLLLDLGLIKKLANGYQVVRNHIATVPEFRGIEAIPFTEMYLDLAKSALQSIEPEKRKFGTLVFSSSKDTFNLIRERLQSFEEEIGDLIEKDSNPEGIYTFSFQAFPNSETE